MLAVNHLEGHIYANFLEHGPPEPPRTLCCSCPREATRCSVHTARGAPVRGFSAQTLDDAAGEAFDKVARFLGLGYPGGPELDLMSRDGNPEAIRFPRVMASPATSTSRCQG